MRKFFWTLICLLGWAGLSAAADEKKPGAKPAESDAANKQEIAALIQAGQAQGKVKSIDVANKSLTFTLEIQKLEVNDNALKGGGNNNANQLRQLQELQKHAQQMMKQQAELARIQNPIERQKKLQQMVQQQHRNFNPNQVKNLNAGANAKVTSPFKVVTDRIDFDLALVDAVNVRLAAPPVEFDEKGNLKQYTAQELKVLKGKENLAGYTGDLASVATGQTIQIVLSKAAPKAGETNKPRVALIMVMNDQPNEGQPAKGAPKKK